MSINVKNIGVSGNTLLLTENGYKPISSLYKKIIKCWNGDDFTEAKIIRSKEITRLYKIEVNRAINILCSKNQEWLTVSRTIGYRNIKNAYKRSISNDLCLNDYLEKSYLKKPCIHGIRKYPIPWVNGFISADGWVGLKKSGNNRYPYATISIHDEDKKKLIDKFKYASKILNLKDNSKYYYHIMYRNDEFIKYITPKFTIPSIDYDILNRVEYLAGYLDGDGSIRPSNKLLKNHVLQSGKLHAQNIKVCSIENVFLLELLFLLNEIGIECRLIKERDLKFRHFTKYNEKREIIYEHDSYCKPVYSLIIGSHGGKLLCDKYNYNCYAGRVYFNTNAFVDDKLISTNKFKNPFISNIELTDYYDYLYTCVEPKNNLAVFNSLLLCTL